jgi:hypothetical protein
MFRRNIPSTSSGSNKLRNIPASKHGASVHAGMLLGLFDPEDEGDMFHINIG